MYTNDGNSAHPNGSSLENKEGQVAKLFCELQEQAFTGIVEISTAEGQTLFTFDIGDPVFVEDSTLRGSLPRSLLEQGIISRKQYATIVARMTEELVDNEDLRFLEIALEQGYLTSDQIFDSITRQLRDKVVEAVSWRGCETFVEDTRGESAGHARFRVSIGPLILAGIKTHYGEPRARAVLGENALHYVRRRDPTGSIAARFDLSDAEMRMVYACDGATTVSAAIERSGLDPLDGLQVMCALKLSSSIEFSAEAWDRKGEGESVVDSFPLFPMAQGSATPPPVPAEASRRREDTVRRGEARPLPPPEKPFRAEPPPPQRPVRAQPPPADSGSRRPQPSPPRATPTARTRSGSVPASSRPPRAGVPRKTVKRTLNRSTLALDRLSRELRKRDVKIPARRATGNTAVQELLQRIPQQREVVEEPAAPEPSGESAIDAWTRGWRYLIQQHIPGAREEFRHACEIAPEQEAYRLYYLWTVFRDTTSSADREVTRIDLKKMAEAHTTAAGHEGFAYYVLAHLALAERNDRVAEKLFRRAADIEPRLKDAERHHRILVNRRQRG